MLLFQILLPFGLALAIKNKGDIAKMLDGWVSVAGYAGISG